MQFNPHELKEKLLKALDRDQNVVDMCKVQEVISMLEKYPITREALEQTRIGRTVNDLRKKTKNPELAKRAKKLVRKWQTLITPPTPSTPNTSVGVNGEGVAEHRLGPGAGPPGPHIPPHVLPGSKPTSPASRPGTPFSGGKSSTSSPSLLPSRPTTPATQHGARVSPKAASAIRPHTPGFKPGSPALATSTPVSGGNQAKIPGLTDTPRSHYTTNPPSSRQNVHGTLSKTNVANKRKRRAEASISPGIPDKISKGDLKSNANGDHNKSKKVINGTLPSTSQTPNGKSLNDDSFSVRKNANLSIKTPVSDLPHKLERTASSNSLHSDRSGTPITRTPISARTPKVKTTAQLIQDLQSRKDINISGSETVTKITRNQIQKEHETEVSIVPAGAKPRPRRTPGTSLNPPLTSDVALSRTKNEMVHKFLETSVRASQADFSSLHLNGPMTPMGDPESHPVGETPTVDSSNVDSGHASLSSAKEDPLMASPPITDASMSGNKESSVLAYLHEQHPHLSSMKLEEEEVLRLLAEDPFALLPPLDPESVPCEKNSPPSEPVSPDSHEVTDSDVNRLHEEHWPGVNGHYDHNHDWHDWTQTCSLPTVNGDPLHILPYVCLDD